MNADDIAVLKSCLPDSGDWQAELDLLFQEELDKADPTIPVEAPPRKKKRKGTRSANFVGEYTDNTLTIDAEECIRS